MAWNITILDYHCFGNLLPIDQNEAIETGPIPISAMEIKLWLGDGLVNIQTENETGEVLFTS